MDQPMERTEFEAGGMSAVDQVAIAERVALIKDRSVSTRSRTDDLKLALSLIDLTTLEGSDTDERIRQLCHKARHLDQQAEGLPSVAAVCVYPNFVRVAREALEGSTVKVASVAGGFPGGQIPMKLKVAETEYAIEEGADEIDLVISRGKFLEGEYEYVRDEIAAVKEVCGKAMLKTILETTELGTYENVRLASEIAINAGSDMIKTSTGKVMPAATLENTLVMSHVIREHYSRTGRMIGLKPAGGIRESEQALQFVSMVRAELGEEWLDPKWFRIGASSLVDDILIALRKVQ